VKRSVRLRSAAETDLAEQARFLEERSAGLGIHFLDAFDATVGFLETSPEIGGMCNFDDARLDEMRVVLISGFKNYLIFYRILPDEIEVVRVLHGSRDASSVLAP
jgi:toxin ParE1/3/4